MQIAVASSMRRRAFVGVLGLLAFVSAGCIGAGRLGPAPPPAPGATAAVVFIDSQIGKPYCYAGAGPACFDCSGLVMRAWQAGGLTLPHFSGAQYAMFPAVPLTQLKPGDLLFPADPNQHVAMYVGSGLIVHATHTGDFVRAEPLNTPGLGLVLAVRPG